MKKLLTGLMLATASFMLLFSVSNTKVYALETDTVTFEVVSDSDGFEITPGTYEAIEALAVINAQHRVSNLISITKNGVSFTEGQTRLFFEVSTNQFRFGNGPYYLINEDNAINYSGAVLGDEFVITFQEPQEHIEASYQDLFYEEVKIDINLITADGITTMDFTEQDAQYLYDNLDSLVSITSDVTFNMKHKSYGNEYYNNNEFYVDKGFYGPNPPNNIGYYYFIMSELEENSNVFIRFYTKTLSDSGNTDIVLYNNILDHEHVTLTLTFKSPKPWTQAHDYGHIRSTSDVYLNYDEVNDTAHISHNSGTNIDVSQLTFGGDYNVNASIIINSPYQTFKIKQASTTLFELDNIAAVIVHVRKQDPQYILNVEAWYWDDGVLTYTTSINVQSNASSKTYNFELSGGVRKAIDYQDVMVANVDELTPLEDFLVNMVAWDALDGDISDQVYIVDDGGYAPDVVSVYNVEFGVENSYGLESTVIVPVHVVDIVAPVISGASDAVQIGYNETFNVATWVASLTVSDNYYEGLTISLQTDTYTANKSKLGTYQVTVRSVDPSGNEGTLTRSIQVVDGIGPVFSGIETITASINEALTAEQIKGSLAAIDAIDGNVTSSITVDSDGLAGNNQTPGTYQVTFMAEDAAGNQTFYIVTATIVTSPPGFYVINANSVRLLPGANLTIEQILDILGASDAVGVSTNYDVNTPGVYSLSFKLDDVDYNIAITLLGVNDPILPDPILPDESSNYNVAFYILGAALTVAVLIVVIRKRK